MKIVLAAVETSLAKAWKKFCGDLDMGSLAGEAISTAVQMVAFPGLGTGVGQIDFKTCARQVRAAIEDALYESQEFTPSWAEAQIRHQKLYTDRVRDLQFG